MTKFPLWFMFHPGGRCEAPKLDRAQIFSLDRDFSATARADQKTARGGRFLNEGAVFGESLIRKRFDVDAEARLAKLWASL
jgi:hypothetical protein